VIGPAGIPVPDQVGFTLIGNADADNLRRFHPTCLNGFSDRRQHGRPYVCGIMFDPSGFRVDLPKFSVSFPANSELFIYEKYRRSSGTLVNG
jgi:hypothetical protein